MRRLAAVAVALALLAPAGPADAREPGCHKEPISPENPTGWVGCTLYGEGIASHWGGPGVARNDCVWPWTRCTPVKVTSLTTGRSITVTPTMYCNCYVGTPKPRLIDLDPAAVAALGLTMSQGLYPVRVEPLTTERLTSLLPNTATRSTLTTR